MQAKCPACHAVFSLEVAAEGSSARDLLQFLAGVDGSLGRALLPYLAMFRSGSRAISFERALRLAQEVLGLDRRPEVLARALSDTVVSLRQKQALTGWRPLRNHAYLQRVLEAHWADEAKGSSTRPQRVSEPVHQMHQMHQECISEPREDHPLTDEEFERSREARRGAVAGVLGAGREIDASSDGNGVPDDDL